MKNTGTCLCWQSPQLPLLQQQVTLTSIEVAVSPSSGSHKDFFLKMGMVTLISSDTHSQYSQHCCSVVFVDCHNVVLDDDDWVGGVRKQISVSCFYTMPEDTE